MTALFYSGSATIDEQMFLRKADSALYKFIGQNIYGSISHCIHPDDFHRFQEAFRELQNNKVTKNFVSVRIKSDDSYEWSLIELTQEPFDLNGMPLIHLNVSTFTENPNYNSQSLQSNLDQEIYLNLLGGILLSYESETGLLSIYMNCNGQTVSLYRGSFQNWKESFAADKADSGSINEFHILCSEIESGKEVFKHSIMANGISNDGSQKLLTFNCQSVRGSDASYKVLGCISVSGGPKEMSFNFDSSMDSGIPILSKKAITEYAKKAMFIGHETVYLIILDLDNFKTINDTYGHMFGDEVLAKTADIIKETIGNTGVVGRIGGDEMMIVLTRIESHAELRNMLRSIRTGIEWAYKGVHDNLHVTCSIGLAAYPQHGDNYDQIFQLADRMLYIAKNKGKNRYVIYTPELHDETAMPASKPKEGRSPKMLKDDKTGVMHRLMDEFLIRKIIPYRIAVSEIGNCFELDEIVMIYGDMKVSTTWNHEGVFNDIESDEYLNLEPSFFECFDENNVYAVNGIYVLESKSPILARLLPERSIESVLFYKMTKNGNMYGYIMFAKKNRRQMWAEYEKILLASIGKIMELSFTGK